MIGAGMGAEIAPNGTLARPALSIRGLTVEFDTPAGVVRAVDDVSYDVRAGQITAVVGETGSGKTVTALAATRLLAARNARVVAGKVFLGDRDLLRLPAREVRHLLGRELAMIFQDPVAALNPVFRVGDQIREALLVHDPSLGKKRARRRAIELLELTGVPEAAERYRQYPHQFSGGMAQRAVIAMAIANRPNVLIADEPTTALDVTVQAQILDVLRTAQAETGAGIILITHNLGVVAETASVVQVMYAGRLVEVASTRELFRRPSHPYTLGLLRCIPSLNGPPRRLLPIPGQPPDLTHLPSGCPFHLRCFLARGRAECAERRPDLRPIGTSGHTAACHFAEEMTPNSLTCAEEPEATSDSARTSC
jgi:peptide/nickel transport system ATP-binding protein